MLYFASICDLWHLCILCILFNFGFTNANYIVVELILGITMQWDIASILTFLILPHTILNKDVVFWSCMWMYSNYGVKVTPHKKTLLIATRVTNSCMLWGFWGYKISKIKIGALFLHWCEWLTILPYFDQVLPRVRVRILPFG